MVAEQISKKDVFTAVKEIFTMTKNLLTITSRIQKLISDGTNPSTARNDVKVEMTWKLGSLEGLDSTLALPRRRRWFATRN